MSESEYQILSMFGMRQYELVGKFNKFVSEGKDYTDVSEEINFLANKIINLVVKMIDVYKNEGGKEKEINELLNMICDEEEIIEVYEEYSERKNEFF